MNQDDVDLFEKLTAQLDGIYQEMLTLVKKSPNDAVNKFKLKFINVTLRQCNKLFGDQHRPFEDFEVFLEDDVPSNSDISFIIAQYIECAKKYRLDNSKYERSVLYWKIGESEEKNSTDAPRKIRVRNPRERY